MGYFVHGLSYDPIYKKWDNIRARCYNKKAINYKYYGERGVKMCDEWLKSVSKFYDYVMALPNAMKPSFTLDRINNDGNYEPGNIRWTTKHVQKANQNIMRNNTSGFVGVSFDRAMNKWRSTISVNKKRFQLGFYELIDDAVDVRNNFIVMNDLIEYKLQ